MLLANTDNGFHKNRILENLSLATQFWGVQIYLIERKILLREAVHEFASY